MTIEAKFARVRQRHYACLLRVGKSIVWFDNRVTYRWGR